MPARRPPARPERDAGSIRINRYLASAGLGSRRACETLVAEGRVTLNGKTCSSLATLIGPKDAVKVDGKLLRAQEKVRLALHKPRGYLCTCDDPRGRRTILDLMPSGWPRMVHVGRLDRDSEGLIFLTNDGEFALRLTHPRYKVEKEYEVTLDRPYDPAHTDRLLKGIWMEGGKARAQKIQPTGPKRLRVILLQGLKRQIRQMFYQLGYEVERLVRTRIGTVTLSGLRPGQWRMLTHSELKDLGELSQK